MFASKVISLFVLFSACNQYYCTVPTIHYSHNMRILKLPRTTPVGSLIYRLKASAALENPLKFVIANGTDVNLINIKSVDFYQANVYLNKPLEKNEYNFTIYVTDDVERTFVDCQIVVKNGSQLMISSFIYFKPLLSVSESASFNSTIGYIHVKEKDNSNLPVTFEIEGSDCFGIRYIFGPKGTSKAEIYLKTQLDFETKNLFRLRVYALNAWTNETFDTRNIVMKELIITVINEQDTPPIFKQMPHLIQLTEATESGDVILTLHAIDGDQEQDRIIKYYLKQDDQFYKYFQVDSDTGEVVFKGTIDSLREFVGHENLFTLTFVAKKVDQDDNVKSTRTKVDINNNMMDHLIDDLSEDSVSDSDLHNHYVANDHFHSNRPLNNQAVSSLLTSDLLIVDTQISNKVNNTKANSSVDELGSQNFESIQDVKNIPTNKTNSTRKIYRSQNQTTFQPTNHVIINRSLPKSMPSNVSSLVLPSRNSILHNITSESSNLNEIARLLKPPINLTNEFNEIDHTFKKNPMTNNLKFHLIPNHTKFESVTQRSTLNKSIPVSINSDTFSKSKKRPSITATILPITSKPLIITHIKNQENTPSDSIKNMNLFSDDLIANEHYIVNNLTSIGLMNDNLKFKNFIGPKATEENSHSNNERATSMNAALSESANTSKMETEINIGFIILQISNHAPEFPTIRTNFTNENNQLFIIFGQIEENSRQNTLVQLEQELLIIDQDHGLNGTFDVELMDATKTFDIQPKNGYRNQTFQIQLINSNQLRRIKNKQVNLKIIAADRSQFKSLKNEIIISVQILDTNDNFPQFVKNYFKATINEKEQVGTIITRVSAVDSDSGDYGQITYSHLLGGLSSNLALNQQTGEITLVSLENIDREIQDLYTLIIYVCDNHCKPKESNSNQTLLLIEILDFNDNKPKFSIARYDYMLNSDLLTFSSPIQISATDADEPNTPNSNVTYEIISGNLQNKFKINELTGEIHLTSPLLIEGSETLPITDLENNDPSNNDSKDNGINNEKNRIIDYSWTEDNFDIVHLDNLFSFFSPVINLTIRAHDQGIPILDNYINVYIHCKNYINRTVVFLVNESELIVKHKKSEYEKYLSEMTSGRVRIRTMQELPAATNLPNRTLIYSTITYPSQSIINVNKVNWYSSKILGTPLNMLNVPSGWSWFNLTGINRQGRNQFNAINTHTVKTAGLDSNNFITWLLIMIILISLIFLLILIAIWCYFCGCRKSKNKINSADSNNYYNHHLKTQHTQQMNKQLLKHQQLENDSIDSQTADYIQKTIDIKKSSEPIQRSNYLMSEFDASLFNGRLKKRIKPGSITFENTGYISDTDPLGNFILTERKSHSAPDNAQRAYVDNTNALTLDKQNFNRIINTDVQNNLINTYNDNTHTALNQGWFIGDSDGKRIIQANNQHSNGFSEKEQSSNDLYATIKRNKVKFTDEGDTSESEGTEARRSSQDETSVKQFFDKHRTPSQLTFRSQSDQMEIGDIKEKQNLSEQDDSIAKLPKAILKNADYQKRLSTNVSPSSDTGSGLSHKEIDQKNNADDQRENFKGKESIKYNEPPKPPPLPMTSQQVHHVAQKLHLKNEDVAQKKSVFTIAYNGVKTDRLNSADSSTIYI